MAYLEQGLDFSFQTLYSLLCITTDAELSFYIVVFSEPLKWISDTVLSNFRCHANLADTAGNLVHNTKNLFNVKLYY